MTETQNTDRTKAEAFPYPPIFRIEVREQFQIAKMRNPDQRLGLAVARHVFKEYVVVKSRQAFVGVDGGQNRHGISQDGETLARE